MRLLAAVLITALTVQFASAAAPEPPLDETRLSVSTLVREDIFAGWMEDDMERFARGEKNLEILLEKRPEAAPEILGWKGGAKLYRAALANEAGDADEFQRYFDEAREAFAAARDAGPGAPIVNILSGGAYVLFADRLPEQYRADAWKECLSCYESVWELQKGVVDKLPLHIGGELLAGLAQSSQRTGDQEKLDKYLGKIIEVMPDSQYGEMAKEWQADPQLAAEQNISCKYCHEPGQLEARVAGLKKRDERRARRRSN